MPSPHVLAHDVVRVTDGRLQTESDQLVLEEPLEIRISGETLAVTMRTPGNDRELVIGLLLAEGIISSANDVTKITHCGRIGDPARPNTMDVTLAPGVKPPVDSETGMLVRRGTLVTSSCGVCGRQSITDLLARIAPLTTTGDEVRAPVIAQAMRTLRAHQPLFSMTGGCHAASLVALDGNHVATFEDVGRHNAIDKVVGSRLLAGALPATKHFLVVSGRASFEVVQKALSAGISVVASVSAPSSLAVTLAESANLTLVGFVREQSMTIYSGAERITS